MLLNDVKSRHICKWFGVGIPYLLTGCCLYVLLYVLNIPSYIENYKI